MDPKTVSDLIQNGSLAPSALDDKLARIMSADISAVEELCDELDAGNSTLPTPLVHKAILRLLQGLGRDEGAGAGAQCALCLADRVGDRPALLAKIAAMPEVVFHIMDVSSYLLGGEDADIGATLAVLAAEAAESVPALYISAVAGPAIAGESVARLALDARPITLDGEGLLAAVAAAAAAADDLGATQLKTVPCAPRGELAPAAAAVAALLRRGKRVVPEADLLTAAAFGRLNTDAATVAAVAEAVATAPSGPLSRLAGYWLLSRPSCPALPLALYTPLTPLAALLVTRAAALGLPVPPPNDLVAGLAPALYPLDAVHASALQHHDKNTDEACTWLAGAPLAAEPEHAALVAWALARKGGQMEEVVKGLKNTAISEKGLEYVKYAEDTVSGK